MSTRGRKFANGMVMAALQSTTSLPVLVGRRGGVDQPTPPPMETYRCEGGERESSKLQQETVQK